MQKRYKLRRHIVSAWHQVLGVPYCERRINSERALQFFFCTSLMEQFKDVGVRSIYIEPTFRCPENDQLRSPDVVVTHSKQIIAVIELKYQPRGNPSFTKDLETLAWFSSVGSSVSLENERYLGPEGNERSYTVAPDAVLCWAGIYKGPEVQVHPPEELDGRLLLLHGLTARGERPVGVPANRDAS